MTVMDETVEGIFASQIVEMNGAISGVEAPGTRLAVLNRGKLPINTQRLCTGFKSENSHRVKKTKIANLRCDFSG